MISALQSIFEVKNIVDDREALLTFKLPFFTNDWALFAPKAGPWLQMAIFVLIQSVIQCIFAVIVYKLIVQRRNTVESFLLGWGFVIPMSCYLPFYLMELFDTRNKVMNLSASTLMTCIAFRCIEAMYDTSPAVVESSLLNYCAYYSSPVPFKWDEKEKGRKKVTLKKMTSFTAEILFTFTAASILLSFLMHYNFRPFGDDHVSLDVFHITWDLVSLRHIANAYFHALLVYFTLSTGFNLTALNEMMKGYDVRKIFDSPFLRSRSPTEFWTERWNIMIQQILQTGVFFPLKKYFSSSVSVFLTFVISGLYHEYVWMCTFYSQKHLYGDDGTCENCHEFQPGRVTCFFAYVGLIMVLERPLGKLAPFQWIKGNIPRPVLAHSLVLIHLPLSLWYYGDWITGGYFDNFSICLWSIRSVEGLHV